MKRFFAVLAALFLAFQLSLASAENVKTTEKEILFRSIPWGTSAKKVQSILKEDGLGVIYSGISEDQFVPFWNIDNFDLNIYPGRGANGSGVRLLVMPKNGIAGHDVIEMDIYCAYSLNEGKIIHDFDSTEFYLAISRFDVIDCEYAEQDIKTKLIGIYGEPSEVFQDESDGWSSMLGNYNVIETATIWYDNHDSAICLKHNHTVDENNNHVESISDTLTLTYGKTNYEEKLKAVEQAFIQEQKDAERLKNEQNVNNTDGL